MNAERGYFTFSGYMGYVAQTQAYQLFATEMMTRSINKLAGYKVI